MPAVDTVLLPLCVGLTLLGVIATGIAWRRGNRGRVIQGIGLALAPIALYFSGLLRLLWDAMCGMHARGMPTDPITVTAHRAETGDLGKMGGAPYLHTLTAGTPSAANAGATPRPTRRES